MMILKPAFNKVSNYRMVSENIIGFGNDHIVFRSKIKGKVIKVLHTNSPVISQNLPLDKKILNIKQIINTIESNFPSFYLNTRVFSTLSGYLIIQDYINGKELSLKNIPRVTIENRITILKIIIFFEGKIDLFGIGGYYAFKNLQNPIMSNILITDNGNLKIIDYDKMLGKHSEKSKIINTYNILLLLYPHLDKTSLKKHLDKSFNPIIFLTLILDKVGTYYSLPDLLEVERALYRTN